MEGAAMVDAVRGRGGDFIARYEGAGGAPSFGPSGEDTLGAGGAGGVEDAYFPPSAGRVHELFSKSSSVFTSSPALLACGAPAGGVGIPPSTPAEVEVVQNKKEAPDLAPSKPEEKNPCDIVLTTLERREMYTGVFQVVTAFQETGYFLAGEMEEYYFRLIPATQDYGSYPFKEGHKLWMVYPKKDYPNGGIACENTALGPKTNKWISALAHEFLLEKADEFEKHRGDLKAVSEWAPHHNWLIALFADEKLGSLLSQSPINSTPPSLSEDSVEFLRMRFREVGIEEIGIDYPRPYKDFFSVYSHIRDHQEDMKPKFFVIQYNCSEGRICHSLVHNYNEDLDFYYVGRKSKGPEEYYLTLTLSEDKIVDGHKFPKDTEILYKNGEFARAKLGDRARVQGNIFHKGTELNFVEGKLDNARIFQDHYFQGKRFFCRWIGFDEKGKSYVLPPLIAGVDRKCDRLARPFKFVEPRD